MEYPNGKDNKKWVCLAEVFGTFVLTVSVNYGSQSGGIAPALGQFACCILIGPISNAHINPAVTMGTLLYLGISKDNFLFTLAIWLAQLIGAILAMLWVRMSITVDSGEITSPNIANLEIDGGFLDWDNEKVQFWDIFVIELFATFMFVILCLGIGDLQGKDLNVNAMAVALSLFFAINLSGDNTGGSLNPVIGLVQNVFLKIYDEHDHKTWKILLVHILGPLAGGILAGPVFKLIAKGKKLMKIEAKVQIIDSTKD